MSRNPFDVSPLIATRYESLLSENQNLVLRVSDGTRDGTFHFWAEDGTLFWQCLDWTAPREASSTDLSATLDGDATTQLLSEQDVDAEAEGELVPDGGSDPELEMETRVEAIEHLQQAICALLEDDYGAFSERLGKASREVNEATDVPYHLQDAGGVPVEEYGPSIALPRGHSAWVTLPGAGERLEHDFAVNFYDHFHVFVDGEHKGEPTFTIRSDEFDTALRIDDIENSFTSIEHVDCEGGCGE